MSWKLAAICRNCGATITSGSTGGKWWYGNTTRATCSKKAGGKRHAPLTAAAATAMKSGFRL